MKFNNINVQIGRNVKLGSQVKIGDHTVIYDNVEIGDSTIISDHCVIGEPLNDYYRDPDYVQPKTVIGPNSLVRSYNTLYAGSQFGSHFNTGHRVTIRELTQIGNHCSVGSYNDIQGTCSIGDYCRFHSYVNIGQGSQIGDFVFIYPYTVLTNDPTPPSEDHVPVTIGSYSQIAAGTVLLPGVQIGRHCLVAAHATVGGIYPDDSFVAGTPAKRIGALSKMPFFNSTKKRHYPWPYHFDRGMPWRKEGYEAWLKKQGQSPKD